MSSPSRILEGLAQGKLRTLDLGSFENQWQRFERTGENAGCASFEDFLGLLEGDADRLDSVEVVNLAENRLHRLPPFIARLPRLLELNLYRNQLTELPTCLASARRLRVLRLRENELQRLPEVILELSCLDELYLGNNPLTELPAGLSALPRLRILSLVHTGIREIPAAIVDMPSLVDLDWRNAPLARIADLEAAKIPRSVIAQGLNAWRAYRADLSAGASSPDEVKLVLVGNGQVGKTTLLQNLLYPDVLTSLDRDATPGLDVRWSVALPRVDPQVAGRVRINLWDFGGQGKYRQVQQLFCTPEAIYVYVTTPDGAKAEDDDRYVGDDYWLSMISAFHNGDGSGRAPRSVFYVVSKIDQSRSAVLIDESEINQRFPAVREFHKVSFLTGDGVGALRRALAAHLESAQQLEVSLPRSWHEVRDYLRRHCTKPFITRREFYDLCDRHGLPEREAKLALLGYLNHSGALLQFDKGLKHRILLDPDWVRDAVYAVLDYEPAVRRGWFTDDDLMRFWERYPEEDHDELLALMKAFELCYEVREEGERRYVVPALFPAAPPAGYRFEVELKPGAAVHRVRCRFTPFLPAGVVAQLMVRLGGAIHPLTLHRWRTGLVLRLQDTLIEVREDWRRGVLEVALAGADWAAEYRVIRRVIEALRQDLVDVKGITTLAMHDAIPCPCTVCRTGAEEEAHWFDVDRLLKAPAHGAVTCPQSFQPVAVAELLGGQGGAGPPAPPRVFISYNRRDRTTAKRLGRLLEQRGVEPTIDDRNPLGDGVDDFIRASLRESDAMVLLVSRHSLTSVWVQREVMLSHELGKRIMPYVLESGYDDDDFHAQVIEHLDRRLAALEAERVQLVGSRSSTRNVDAEIHRHQDARNNVDQVLWRVRDLARLDPCSGGSLEEHADAIVRSLYQSRNE